MCSPIVVHTTEYNTNNRINCGILEVEGTNVNVKQQQRSNNRAQIDNKRKQTREDRINNNDNWSRQFVCKAVMICLVQCTVHAFPRRQFRTTQISRQMMQPTKWINHQASKTANP
jgi:hypothetical protein